MYIGHRRGSDPALLWLCTGSGSSDWIPSLGTSICHGYSPKKKNKKKRLPSFSPYSYKVKGASSAAQARNSHLVYIYSHHISVLGTETKHMSKKEEQELTVKQE